MSRIGHSSRRWNRSISEPRDDSLASPPVISSAWVKPWPRRCRVSASQPAGANPQPKSTAACRSKPRSARNWRAGAASGRAELLDVERRRGGIGGDQPGALTHLRAVGAGGRTAAVVLVAQLDVGPPGEQFDRLGEGQMVDLLDEGNDVAANSAPEAIPREDVVLECEGVCAGDLGAEDFLDPVAPLDRLDNPVLALVLLLVGDDPRTVLVEKEERLRQALRHEPDVVDVTQRAIDALPCLLGDAERANAEPRTELPDVLEVRWIGRVEDGTAVVGNATICGKVASQPAEQVRRILVQRWTTHP